MGGFALDCVAFRKSVRNRKSRKAILCILIMKRRKTVLYRGLSIKLCRMLCAVGHRIFILSFTNIMRVSGSVLDGQLREVVQPPVTVRGQLASRIKVMSRLDISEKRIPQDGRMQLTFQKGGKPVDFRVSTLPTLFGEKVVMRILNSDAASLNIDQLGFEPFQKKLLLDAIHRPYGMGVGNRSDRFGKDCVALYLFEYFEYGVGKHCNGGRSCRD